DVTPTDVDLVVQCQRDRLTGDGFGEITVSGHEPCHGGLPTRRKHAYPVAGMNRATDNHAGAASEILVGTIHPLHRKSEGAVFASDRDFDCLEVPHEGGAVVPG